VSTTLKPAELDISKDIISTNCGKDPSDPQWKDDPGPKAIRIHGQTAPILRCTAPPDIRLLP
jgi:hypothetical protein